VSASFELPVVAAAPAITREQYARLASRARLLSC
jgi:hypothetical protein